MRKILSSFLVLGAVGLLSTGCSGPEKKLGRGLSNLTEFTRMGEIRRSIEQASLYSHSDTAMGRGVITGFNRSVLRTFVGAFEVLTFPFPGYEPYLKPGNNLIPDMTVDPVYPDASKPNIFGDPSWSPNQTLGFTGGDILPMVPGSRFRIYDY